MKKSYLILIFIFIVVTHIKALGNNDTTLVYKFDIKQEIGPAVWRITQQSLNNATDMNADLVLIHMNTYGGALISADSIRTAILNYKKPVYVFIDNNAASAGALISIACDRIYMRKGASIGAATVVNQSGEKMPEKIQAYMRGMMRSTSEAHGKDTIIENGDTTFRWKRDPLIAEAMVDENKKVEGVIDTGQLITFTTEEAIRHRFCEGEATGIEDVIEKAGFETYVIKEYKLTRFEKLMGWLVSPYLQGILIMIIIGGIYFELQTPGIGFPLAAAFLAAIVYFAPLYLEGLAEHWEILIFIIGILLLAVEIFVIPGFGVAGIAGIVLTITGLSLSMIDNVNFEFTGAFLSPLFKAFSVVIFSMFISLILSLYISKKMFTGNLFGGLALNTVQEKDEGYIGVSNLKDTMAGKEGIAATILRPSGKVEIDGEIYDATALTAYIDKGVAIKVVRYETGQLYVRKI